MKLPAIKTVVENYTLDQLRQAEAELSEEKPLSINIPGDDEGEQLTHVLAAIYIKEQMEQGIDYTTAIRQYSQRVRTSISS